MDVDNECAHSREAVNANRSNQTHADDWDVNAEIEAALALGWLECRVDGIGAVATLHFVGPDESQDYWVCAHGPSLAEAVRRVIILADCEIKRLGNAKRESDSNVSTKECDHGER